MKVVHDVEALQAIVAAQAAGLAVNTDLIAVLRGKLGRLSREQFGRPSEGVARNIEQPGPLLEELDAAGRSGHHRPSTMNRARRLRPWPRPRGVACRNTCRAKSSGSHPSGLSDCGGSLRP